MNYPSTLDYSLVRKKACGSEPYYCTYETTMKKSQIPRINTFPYPFYFVSNPLSDEVTINPRRAGWSKELVKGKSPIKPDKYPNHCFQSGCKTIYTELGPETDEIDLPYYSGKSAVTKSCGAGAEKPAAPSGKGSAVPPASSGGKGGCSRNKCINLYR